MFGYTNVPEEGSLADRVYGLRGIGIYDPDQLRSSRRVQMSRSGEGAIGSPDGRATEWKCLPDALQPWTRER